MDYPYFRSLIYHSANQYLDYLEYQFSKGNKSAGRNVVAVWDIQPGTMPTDFYLTTAERIVQPDHCQIWVRGILQENIRILQVLKSHGRTHTILIRDEGDSLKEFGKLYPHDIQIISDMTFLIRRLRDFYLNHEFSFHPPMPQSVPELPSQFTEGLSDEQLAAVNGVFTTPVSYINGAPGTGKTRMVMSRCVLRYILNGKRVFLLAPTNNAVEQMLRSILPVLKESGIDLEKVYRIGTSTEEFADEYPQVAADASLDILRENLTEQSKYLDEQVCQARKILADFTTIDRRLNDCRKVNFNISKWLEELRITRCQYSEAVLAQKLCEKLLTEQKAPLDNAKKDLENITAASLSCESTIHEYEKRSSKLLYRIFCRNERRIMLDSIVQLKAEQEKRNADMNSARIRCRELQQKIDATQENLDNSVAQQSKLSAMRKTLVGNLSFTSRFDKEYYRAVMDVIDSPAPSSTSLDEFFSHLEAQHKELQTQVNSNPLEKLLVEQSNVKDQLANIATSAKQLQRQNALVLAGTIDASLKTLIPEDPADKTIPVSHVFLDEAGYTSLARGMAAFSCGAPVTFLGDHRQLPPICEMNNIKPNNAPICLWALSIAYYHELVCGDFMELYDRCYCRQAEPSFSGLSRFSLNLSYRFGTELANILARYIYNEHFRGIAEAPFEIEIIDAPYTPGRYKRSSISEASGILHYVKSHPNDDIAILAPYRGQIKLLTETLPPDFKDSILTVHRSQGREWDTVILSVVDTRNPYFVDSMLPIGRAVLNTAISRTRRKLILVCDTTSWIRKQNQIITSLIQYAQSRKLPSEL